MPPQPSLLEYLGVLKELFDDFADTSESPASKQAFQSASRQCESVIAKVEAGDLTAAADAWRALTHFADDAIGISEGFLELYHPLRKMISNAGLE